MQLTPKFILIAIAFAYGGTAVSAVPARESSVMARSAEYEDLGAREIDDMELFVREPFSFFGFGTSSRAHSTTSTSHDSDDSHTGAGLSVSQFRNFNKFKHSDKMLPYNRGQSPNPLLRHLPYTRQNPPYRKRRKKAEVLATIPSQLWT